MTPKNERFVQEYLIDLNATQAAIRAGYSQKTAGQIGEALLKKVEIAEAVRAAQDQRAERTEITADRVLNELWAIATADPNDLIQFRRGACPSCWTLDERPMAPGDPTPSMPINPECPVCAGEGAGRAYIADTRLLTGPAKSLYAGVKISQSGIEVKMHDKAAALVNVGRHLGMFKDKLEVSIDEALASRLDSAVQRARGK